MTVSLISVNLPDFGIPKEQPTINAEIYKERLIKFRADLKNNQINSAVIYADREHFANMHYLTGFDPRFEEALLILHVNEEKTYLITGPENQGYADISEINLIKKIYPPFGLLGQDRSKTPTLESMLIKCGLKKNIACGIIGWKYFENNEFENPDSIFEIPYYILSSISKVVGSISYLKNITSWFMNPSVGYRSKNELEEIAFFEFSSCHTSTSLRNVLNNIQPEKTEFEVASNYKCIGIPLSCHLMFSTGKRASLGLASPSSKKIKLGEPFAAAYGVWGSLNCRVGWIAKDQNDLPDEVSDYFEKLIVPYFTAVKEWYETIGIGVEGGAIFEIIMKHLGDPFFGVYLNPGHLIHRDEWMNSSIYQKSKEIFFSRQAIQLDIIPATNTKYFSTNIEDGIVLLDQEDRKIFEKKYPEAMKRINERRIFMKDKLGINLKPEVMPLSNIPAYLNPFILSKNLTVAFK